MQISGTIFKSLFDNKTQGRFDLANFDAFERVLYEILKVILTWLDEFPNIQIDFPSKVFRIKKNL